MQLPDVVDKILNHICTIKFEESATKVSLFGSTIRYLGPMLSAHDLLRGPFAKLTSNVEGVECLVRQSIRLADALSFTFDTPSGIPHNQVLLTTHKTKATKNDVSAIGTLLLEWTHLSDVTGDPKYTQLVQKAQSHLLDPRPALSEPFPGLIGRYVNIATGLLEDSNGGWFSGAGSFYEYLIKMYVYDAERFSKYKERWVLAADSSIKHLASNPSTRPDLTFLAQYNGTELIYLTDHTSLFSAASFLLGGTVLNERKYVDFGLRLVESLRHMYLATATGIGPEAIGWLPSWCNGRPRLDAPDSCTIPPQYANQTNFYKRAGYYITNPTYMLRPEVLESIYYAYRVTRDPKYQDWAWEIFLTINATTRAGSGFAELVDVNQMPEAGGLDGRIDRQYSFMLSEVLKYAYIIHLEVSPLSILPFRSSGLHFGE